MNLEVALQKFQENRFAQISAGLVQMSAKGNRDYATKMLTPATMIDLISVLIWIDLRGIVI
jgi:hypothetical protein